METPEFLVEIIHMRPLIPAI